MDLDRFLIKAIQSKTLAKSLKALIRPGAHQLDQSQSEQVESALTACENIQIACRKAADSLSTHLSAAGIANSIEAHTLESPQTHQFGVVINAENPTSAVSIANRVGYRSNNKLSDVQWEIFWRTNDSMTLTRTDDVTMRLKLRWNRKLPSRWTRKLWPNVQDAGVLSIPAFCWPVTFALRPFGLIMRNFGPNTPVDDIGEFLGTPIDLAHELLKVAKIQAGETVFDLGCGDGRILVEAAKQYQCQARGYEKDQNLCARAKSMAVTNGVADRVQVINSDAMSAPVENANVIFLFLPPQIVSQIVPELLLRLPYGGRIIAHEQSQIRCDKPPTLSLPLFGNQSMTVVHLWNTTA